MLEGLSRFPEDVLFPIEELLPEILKLTLIHEFFVLRRTILRPLSQNCGCFHRHLEPPKLPETRGGLIAKRTTVSITPDRTVHLRRTGGELQLGDLDGGP
jgi:hypothetical protein